ncbi:MAG: hypothetical protein C0504_14060 [Candidatus Solibacter sp.]|nr:hypothetical protein [Candidatus Solibacter sp.]
MEMVEPFGWHVVDGEKLRDIQTKLGNFESMTWGEILNGSQHHLVPMDRLCSKAWARLNELGQNDLESLLSIRLSGKERVWGILAEGVCTLIWWDPEHEICPSMLRYT